MRMKKGKKRMSDSSLQTAGDLGSGNWETVSAKKMAARYVASVLSVFAAPILEQR